MRVGGDAYAKCGTTALVALLLGRRVYVANVGDSRAVLCRRGRCIELSADHKPGDAAERLRIEARCLLCAQRTRARSTHVPTAPRCAGTRPRVHGRAGAAPTPPRTRTHAHHHHYAFFCSQEPLSRSDDAHISPLFCRQAAGGFVDGEGYLNGTLGVSRALGDWQHVCPRAGTPLKHAYSGAGDTSVDASADASAPVASPLSADADVTEHELTEEDEFLLLACDGLWDVVSSPNAVQIARQQLQRHNDPAQLAADLAHEAIHVRHSGDNVTVVAVCLSAAAPPVRLTSGGGLPARNGSRLFARSMSQEVLANLQRALDTDDAIAT
jgi:serine/threonine protein phosphatase PrpC